jgi:Ca2+-binding RTX toxin-like protein
MRQSIEARVRAHTGEPLRLQRSLAAICLAAALAVVVLIAAPFANAAPPMIVDDLAATAQDTPVVINVLANDNTDPPGGPLFVQSTPTPPTDPAHGSVDPNDDDTITYTPDPGYVGPDSFDYVGCNFEGMLDSCDTGTVTVDVDPKIQIADKDAGEQTGSLNFMTLDVTLSAPDPNDTVTVIYTTANGTAVAGSDYVFTSETLTFNPMSTSPTSPLSVPVVADTVDEPDENFFVNLTGASEGVVLAPHDQGLATIIDEDPLVSLSVGDATVVEGNASSAPASFNVTLGAASGKTVTVGYSTSSGTAASPSDYQTTSGQVSFAPGETLKQASVNVVGDTTFEGDETFTVTLASPVNAEIADGSAVGTIQNNDAQLGVNCDIVGTPGADRLTGTAAGERICGMGGNDTISGGGGDDEIFGDAGNDRISGDDGGDAIEGGRGNDTLSGGAGGDSLEGDSGNDVLDSGAGDDTIDGGSGNDVGRGGGGDDVLDGGPGNDVMSGAAGNDRSEGGAGNDRIRGEAGNDFLDGSGDNDRIDGGPGNDQVLGLSGSDRVTGGAGNDLISGGGGADHAVFGSRVTVDLSKARARGEGNDRVLLVEVVTGSGGADTLIGNSARNVLNGGGGGDRLMGRGGGDVLNGGAGNDRLFGQAGRDVLVGSSGNDTCEVGPGGGSRKSC